MNLPVQSIRCASVWNLNLVRRTDSDNLFAIEQDGCFWNRFTVAGVDYRPAAKDDCSAFDSR